MHALIAAIVTSVLLLALRLDVARRVGLADLEALFVAQGFHPQPAYVQHPGLLGWLSRLVAPTPLSIHLLTTAAAAALPWAGVLAARASGADFRSALRVHLPLALLPALCIGSFAFTPDLLLCFWWLLCVGGTTLALRRPPASFAALLGLVAAGVGAALACLSHASGWVLALAFFWILIARCGRERARTLAPWAAGGLFIILVAPLASFAWQHGLEAWLAPDPSPQHAAVALLRPLIGATPPFLLAGSLVALRLLERGATGPVAAASRRFLLVPLAPMALLAALGRAELDWLLPAYLVLALHTAHTPPLRRSLAWTCGATGLGVALLGWSWLSTPLPLTSGRWLGGYEPALDASNELFTWGPAKPLLEEAVLAARERSGQSPVVIGPHWRVCAQAEVALGGRLHVGCDDPGRDDYDDWSHPARWQAAPTVLFVTDSRFHATPPDTFLGRRAIAVRRVNVQRFGQTVRTVSVSEFPLDEATARPF